MVLSMYELSGHLGSHILDKPYYSRVKSQML